MSLLLLRESCNVVESESSIGSYLWGGVVILLSVGRTVWIIIFLISVCIMLIPVFTVLSLRFQVRLCAATVNKKRIVTLFRNADTSLKDNKCRFMSQCQSKMQESYSILVKCQLVKCHLKHFLAGFSFSISTRLACSYSFHMPFWWWNLQEIDSQNSNSFYSWNLVWTPVVQCSGVFFFRNSKKTYTFKVWHTQDDDVFFNIDNLWLYPQ